LESRTPVQTYEPLRRTLLHARYLQLPTLPQLEPQGLIAPSLRPSHLRQIESTHRQFSRNVLLEYRRLYTATTRSAPAFVASFAPLPAHRQERESQSDHLSGTRWATSDGLAIHQLHFRLFGPQRACRHFDANVDLGIFGNLYMLGSSGD